MLLRRFGAAFLEERRLDLRLADRRLADLRLGAALRLDARRRFGAMMTFQLLRNAQKEMFQNALSDADLTYFAARSP